MAATMTRIAMTLTISTIRMMSSGRITTKDQDDDHPSRCRTTHSCTSLSANRRCLPNL